MVNVKAKIGSIILSDFIKTFRKNESSEYEYLIFWLKFQIRRIAPTFLKDFNNIPFGLGNSRPSWYMDLAKLIPFFNENWPVGKTNLSKITSKLIYEKLREKQTQKSSYEINNPAVDWCNALKNVIKSELGAKAITFNYKICLNRLPTLDKFKNFLNKCSICKRKKESIYHLFFECDKPRILLKKIWDENEKRVKCDPNVVLYHINCNMEEIKLLSAFKLEL